MSTIRKREIIALLIVTVTLAVAALSFMLFQFGRSSAPPDTETLAVASEPPETIVPTEAFIGQETLVGDAFIVTVPNGWTASISTSQSFLAIMFARPQKLQTLVYSATTPPTIDSNGIPAWGGLTEHFYIRSVSAAQSFNPAAHQEVSSEPFIFDDGTVGTKFFVVKHAAEATRYGGLLKDDEWQGRTYIYERDGRRVEAHLALYPSSEHDIEFYEEVVRSITPQ